MEDQLIEFKKNTKEDPIIQTFIETQIKALQSAQDFNGIMKIVKNYREAQIFEAKFIDVLAYASEQEKRTEIETIKKGFYEGRLSP